MAYAGGTSRTQAPKTTETPRAKDAKDDDDDELRKVREGDDDDDDDDVACEEECLESISQKDTPPREKDAPRDTPRACGREQDAPRDPMKAPILRGGGGG